MVANNNGGAAKNADVILTEAREILRKIASAWSGVADPEMLEVVPMALAATNRVYQIRWRASISQKGENGEGTNKNVLLRIYGGELFFNRDDEIKLFEAVSRNGMGPRLLAKFSSGRVEEFLAGRTLMAKDLRDPETSASIARKLREFHNLDMPGPKNVVLWDRLKDWLKEARRLASPEEAKEFCLDVIENEICSMENELSSEDQMTGFCHNDLQYSNMILNEETKQLTLIDYEYAGYNPIAFDIANHFCEMTAGYQTETPYTSDYNKYPDLDERRRFVRVYLSSSGENPEDMEVEIILQNVEKYVFASHLWGALWSIISQHANNIRLDYMEHARQRMQQYWLNKSEASG